MGFGGRDGGLEVRDMFVDKSMISPEKNKTRVFARGYRNGHFLANNNIVDASNVVRLGNVPSDGDRFGT